MYSGQAFVTCPDFVIAPFDTVNRDRSNGFWICNSHGCSNSISVSVLYELHCDSCSCDCNNGEREAETDMCSTLILIPQNELIWFTISCWFCWADSTKLEISVFNSTIIVSFCSHAMHRNCSTMLSVQWWYLSTATCGDCIVLVPIWTPELVFVTKSFTDHAEEIWGALLVQALQCDAKLRNVYVINNNLLNRWSSFAIVSKMCSSSHAAKTLYGLEKNRIVFGLKTMFANNWTTVSHSGTHMVERDVSGDYVNHLTKMMKIN